jgi:hypothetical protein
MDHLENIRGAYHVLAERLQRAAHTQLGDMTRLDAQRSEVYIMPLKWCVIVCSLAVDICSKFSIAASRPVRSC